MHLDRQIAIVASRQGGIVTRGDLVELGLGRGAIQSRVRRGLLHRHHEGVYGWGARDDGPWTRARAAVVASGDGAFISHHSALGLHAIGRHPAGPVDVTVVARQVRRDGIRGHEAAELHHHDIRQLRGLSVSTPARALLEVAADLTEDELAAAVERAQVKRLVRKRELEAAIARAGRRKGVGALRALINEPFTRSKAERLVVKLTRAARLPAPAFNALAEGYEVDVLWRAERVVLEFDSYQFHATRAAFERDRNKTAALTRGRYTVLRATWSELTRQSHALVARIAEALALSLHPR